MNVYGKIAIGFAIAAFLLLPVILWVDISWLWLFILCVVFMYLVKYLAGSITFIGCQEWVIERRVEDVSD